MTSLGILLGMVSIQQSLAGVKRRGHQTVVRVFVAEDVAEIVKSGVELCLVIGGGNIFRGVAGGSVGMDRATADYMGMLATVMNSLALADTMRQEGMTARVMSAISIEQVVEPYVRPKALQYLEEGKVVVFAAGTGNPFFTTDTAAALRAVEIGAEVVLKATKVDGVYDKDPSHHPDAVRYPSITYGRVLVDGLKVLDAAAVSLCMENNLPIVVFDLEAHENILRAVRGEDVGTVISQEGTR